MPNRNSGAVAKQRIPPISYLPFGGGARERAERRFEAGIRALLAADVHVIPLGRARAGIYLLIRQAMRDGRRKVILSPYTIADVVNMVRLAGGEPVFYDFCPESTACDVDHLRSLIGADTACVMVTHYHLNEPRLDQIAAICRDSGVELFDDCALAFGGSVDGRAIGTITDASVFSFSSFKTLNYFWGGAIVTRRDDIAHELRELMRDWTPLALRDYRDPAKGCLRYDLASRPLPFRYLTFPLLRRRAMASGDVAGLEHRRLETEYFDRTLQSRPSTRALAEWNGKMAAVPEVLSARRNIARIYHELHSNHMVSANYFDESDWNENCFVNYPILVSAGARDYIIRQMMGMGFDVGRNLYPNVHQHDAFRGAPGKSSAVADLVDRSIYLPTHFGISDRYAAALSQALHACLAAGPGS